MSITLTRNRGLLVSNRAESRWVQLTYGRGCRTVRVTWLPSWGRISLRVWRDWWVSLGWR